MLPFPDLLTFISLVMLICDGEFVRSVGIEDMLFDKVSVIVDASESELLRPG